MFDARKEVKMSPKKRMNILLADDGSEHARAAVELLQNIPLPPKSRIFVYRAFNSGQIPLIPEMERSLERSKSQLSSAGFKVETEMQLCSPVEGILGRAQEQKSDLIVLGAKGLRSTVSILLGGVAQQVVEYACCPVLIVRAPFHGFRKILLVTDGSPSSLSAARYLGKFPLPAKTDLQIMHVLPPERQLVAWEPYYGGWQTVYAAYPTLEEEEALQEKETKAGRALLQRTCGMLQRHGIDSTSVLARGDAATEIIDHVHKDQVDLIVAGSRGLGQLKSLWMGSVSRKLVHYSDCSILIVKVPRKE
jgi:nucleotide-binding universal stress UspA family protein